MHALYRAQGRIFDRLLGVSTTEQVVTEGSVVTAGGENSDYETSRWLPVLRAIMKLSPSRSDVFVDLGSGKGTVLLMAALLPFRRVIGVEIDEQLSEQARRNVERARVRLRAEVEVVTASVLEWPIPDETSAVFMFNPFIGQTFRAAADQVFASYGRRPRALHILYYYPWEHDWLLSTGRVVVDDVRPSAWPAGPRWWQGGKVIVSYRVVPEGSQPGSPHRRLKRRGRALQRWSKPNGQRFALTVPGFQPVFSSPGQPGDSASG